MALETATYINGLNASNPTATDNKSEGDDHIRLLKSTIKATFPNVSGAVTPTHTELNYVDGVTSAIQTQLDAKLAKSGGTMTGDLVVPNIEVTTNTHVFAGTAGAPGVAFRGDTDTGFYRKGINSIAISTEGVERFSVNSVGHVVVGTAALATNAGLGFFWIPSCPGAPTGNPTAPYTDAAALIVDTTNERLYTRFGGAWRFTELRSARTYGVTEWSALAVTTSNVSGTVNLTGSYLQVGTFITGTCDGVTIDPVGSGSETTVQFPTGAASNFADEGNLSGSGTWRVSSTLVPVEIKAVVGTTFGVATFYPGSNSAGTLRFVFSHNLGSTTP